MSKGDAADLNAVHRATYDGIAARFAAANAQMPPGVLVSARQLRAAVGTPARILDLGSGHGRDAAWFEAHGAAVVAADLSAGMLAEARRRVAGPVVQLDMRDLAFRDAAFDGVWSNAAMLHLPKATVPDALHEVWRVLRPGGVFCVAIKVGQGEAWETVSYDKPLARFFSRYTPEEFGALIEGAGLAVLDIRGYDGGPLRRWAHYLARRG